jgi:glycosyltransferase involved in cell wall biosynthesis
MSSPGTSTARRPSRMDVGAVLITRNQARTAPRLVQSVLAEVDLGRISDVVLVDSASTDGTVESVIAYPIRILRLHPDQLLTAAAGRRAGFEASSGEGVLFLDGDMELHPGWLEEALAVAASPRVGCVTGPVVDVPIGADRPSLPSARNGRTREVAHFAGAALFRRSVLRDAGSFNPYLRSDEESELSIRIRRAGYSIVATDRPLAFHHTHAPGSIGELLARRRRRLYVGHGQAIRYSRRNGLALAYLRERGFSIAPLAMIVLGLAAAIASARDGQPWVAWWLALVSAVFLFDAARKKSPRKTLHSVLLRLFILEGLFRGLVMRLCEPSQHPLRFDVVK